MYNILSVYIPKLAVSTGRSERSPNKLIVQKLEIELKAAVEANSANVPEFNLKFSFIYCRIQI